MTLITVTLYAGVLRACILREYIEIRLCSLVLFLNFASFSSNVLSEILCIQNDPKSDNECEDEMEDANEVYCFCRQQASGIMIACDNKECPYEWFHLDCVGLGEPPGETEEWYCDNCKH